MRLISTYLKALLCVLFTGFIGAGNASAQVATFEYFFDADPGFGNGTPVTTGFTPGNTVNFSMSLPANGLVSGFHELFFRARTASGLWGHYQAQPVYVTSITAGNGEVTAAEYFFDADPGVGAGHPIAVTQGAIVNQSLLIPVTGLGSGFHQLCMRVKNTNGTWSHYQSRAIYISTVSTGNGDIAGAEYFFDTDPGVGNGTALSLNTGTVVNQNVMIPVAGLPTGFHQLYIRTRNTSNSWSHYQSRSFVITSVANAVARKIAGAEYFIDADPGVGAGTAIPINPPGDTINQTFTLSIPSGLSGGTHTLVVRVKNEQGQWSHYQTQTFVEKKAAPGSGYALSFDGSNDYADAHYSVAGQPNTFTYEMWVKPASSISIVPQAASGSYGTSGQQYVVKPMYITTGNDAGMGISVGTNGIQVFEHSNGYLPALLSWSGTINNWTHIAVVYNNKQPLLYVNGVLVASGLTSSRSNIYPYSIDNASEIGRGDYGYYNGKMDELRIWNTALSQSEIRDWMCKKLKTSHPEYASLAGSFNLDEGAGTSAYDDFYGGKLTLNNGAAFETSGAAIGNTSAHSYAGATATATLAHPTRGDALTATLTAGLADGIQVYCVADTPNNRVGTTCLGDNFGYFGVFAVNGTAPEYTAVYNYTGLPAAGIDEYLTKIYKREDNSAATWIDAAGALDTASNTDTVTGTPRGEYIVSNSVVTPTVSVTANPAIAVCAGTHVVFTASITNGGTAPVYQWKKNGVDISGATGATYTDSTMLNGEIISCALVSNSYCANPATANSNSFTAVISTSLIASLTIAPAPGSTICAGTQVTFTATPVNGGTAPVYQWRVNGIATGGNAPTFTSTSFANGDVVTCDMAGNAACAGPATAYSDTVIMTVNPVLAPTITIASNAGSAICSGTSVTFTATITNGGTTPIYQWKKNGNDVGTNTASYIDNALADNDVITCMLTSNALCGSPLVVTSAPVNMTVSSSAAPTIVISSSAGSTICTGAPVTFSAAITNGGTTPGYAWKKNGSTVSSGTDYTTTGLANGDTITCVLTSSASCAVTATALSDTIVMTVNPYATPGVSITASPSNIACAGTNVIFTATPVNGGTSPSFQWKKNGVNVGGNSTIYADNTLATGDSVTCEITSSLMCASVPSATGNTVTMTINPLPVVSAGPDQTILRGSSVALMATGGITYSWSNGDTTATTIVSPLNTADYVVTATNAAGCANKDTAMVMVNFSSLAVSTGSYNFGNVVLNTTATTNITITNNGTFSETVSGVLVGAPFASAFTSQTIAPNATLTVPVSFTPTGLLIYQQTMDITTSTGTFNVVLDGKGVNAAPAWTVAASNYDFGNVAINDSISHTFQISNTGNVPLTISSVTSNSVVFPAAAFNNTIAVGGSVFIEVKFKPTAITGYTGLINILSTTAGLAPLVVNVSGNGYVPGAHPQLTFVAAAPYNGTSGVDKTVAPSGTFNYRIVYKNISNTAPMAGFPKVGIDLNGDGDFIDAGEGMYSMSKIGTGTNWMNGETFTYTQNLSIGTTYGYRFSATDSLGNTAIAVNTAYVSGPLVTNQGLDLAIYANDITFSNNNPAVGQQFTVSAVVHNNSPYTASNVPVRFYKDSVFLTSTVLPFIGANTTATITQNFSFAPDGFYPIKVWIDSANTLAENNPLNNYAIRPVIVGNFSIPGAIGTTRTANTQSCPEPAVSISGTATYSGLNLVGNPPALGATVTVQIANGPTLVTNTVTGGNWSVYYSGLGCGVPYSYTVTVTDYTLTGTTGSAVFTAPCQSCGSSTGNDYPVHFSDGVAGGCIKENLPFNYAVSFTNHCNHDTLHNDTTKVFVDNVLTYTHTTATINPCIVTSYSDAFTLATGNHTMSYTNVFYDTAGRHETIGSSVINVELNLPDLSLGYFSQTGSTSFSVRDIDGVCVDAGAHKILLYDSLSGNAPVLLDSFAVAAIGGQSYQTWNYNNPALQMGYHYLKMVTDAHAVVTERSEINNELNAVVYVPFPELSISNISPSATNLVTGTQMNFSAQLHNTGSSAGAFHVKFYADGVQIGNATNVSGLSANTNAMVVSNAYTVPAGGCPIVITAVADADLAVTEFDESNNTTSFNLATDLTAGVGCYRTGSSCSPYVAVKNIPTHFGTVVTNTGTRDAGVNVVSFSYNGNLIGSDNIPAIAAGAEVNTGVDYTFTAAGTYVINLLADTAGNICEASESNNTGAIYVTVLEGLPDLEILSQHISPSNLNPNPNQTVSVVASVFNKGTQKSKPCKVRFFVDGVQLGADVTLDTLYPGLDTTVAATATYSSATVGPKIFKVKADALDDNIELVENNNEATRAIIVGGAPDFAHSKNEAITFSKSGFRKGQTITIRNYIRNYGGDNGTAYLKYFITNNAGVRTLLDSVQFTLNSNDSARIVKTWNVNMVGNGRITTEIVHSNPLEFDQFNNIDSLDFISGPELNITSLNAASDVICEHSTLNIGYSIVKDGQPVTYEWYHNNATTGNTSATMFSLANAALSDAGNYVLRATDSFGTEESPVKTITVNPVLIPTVSIVAMPGTSICAGNWVKFVATPVNGGPVPVYQWKKNGVNITNAGKAIFIDSLVANGQQITCELVSNAPCTSTAPVGSNTLTMTVAGLSSGLASNASQTNDNDSGMLFNYTDNSCHLIATVSTDSLTDLGQTTATTVLSPVFNGYVQRSVEITPTNNLPATVKLYFLQSEFTDYNTSVGASQLHLPASSTDIAATSNIVIYQFHGLPSSGTTGPGGQYNANNVTRIPTSAITKLWNNALGYWEISFPVTGFSGHFLKAESQVPLAIRLGDISALNKEAVNEVRWNTLTENAGAYFELERSTNGKDFGRIARIESKGKASGYVYEDVQPVTGTNYYRLRMYESNGRSGLSKVVTAAVKQGSFAMEAFPNPAKDMLNVTTHGAGYGSKLRLTDITGNVIQSIELNANNAVIDISGLASGIYFLKYSDDAHQQTIRVVKE